MVLSHRGACAILAEAQVPVRFLRAHAGLEEHPGDGIEELCRDCVYECRCHISMALVAVSSTLHPTRPLESIRNNRIPKVADPINELPVLTNPKQRSKATIPN